MNASREITIFLASSNELDNDRVSFRDLVDSLDDIYKPRGIRVRCRNWRNFPGTSDDRTQNEYDAVTSASDICICMFHHEAGKDTLDEFHQSVDAYKRTGDHPKTYVYVRALVDGEIEAKELTQFKKDLFEKMGHYWCNYATDDTMKLHFVMQFEQLLNEGMPSLSKESNLKVERGSVILHGKKIADYANIPFAANNEDLKALQAKIASLNNQIAELRAKDAPLNKIYPIIEKRNEYQKQLDQLEKQLLDLAISINKTISSGEFINERKRRAIEMFEKGNHKEVDHILNPEDIKADCDRANEKIAMIEQKIAELSALLEAEKENEIQRKRSYVDEYILKANNLMTMYSNPNRFEEACHWYEEAIQETRKGLPKEDLAERLLEYGVFLYVQKQYSNVESYYREALCIYNNCLEEKNSENDESCIAKVLLALAALYSDQNDRVNADANFLRGLSIVERLASTHPELYEMYLAFALKGHANFYLKTERFKEAEDTFLRALSIFEQLVTSDFVMYGLAGTLNDLALLYTKNKRMKEAEEFYLRALPIYERLVTSNSEEYEPHLATVLNNLGLLFSTSRFHESEKYHFRALSIRERLATNNPERYESDLAMTLNNLAYLYTLNKKYNKAEEYYLSSLSIYKRMVVNHPNVYGLDVAQILVDFTLLYVLMKRFKKAKKYSLRALPFIEYMASTNYTVYAEILLTAKTLHQTILEETNKDIVNCIFDR